MNERPTKDECIARVERELARAIVKLGVKRASTPTPDASEREAAVNAGKRTA